MIRELNRYLLLCIILLNAALCSGQYHSFKHYQVTSGLSSNTVTCITQDKKGFIWIGTRNGLNRFDGVSYKVFKTNISDPYSLGNNSILSIHEDSAQQVWVGTYKGIYIYNPLIESFTLFKDVPQVEVRSIKEDKTGNIWIVADNTLYRFSPGAKKIKVYDADTKLAASVAISPTGAVWSALRQDYIRKYDPVTDTHISFNLSALRSNKEPLFIQTIYPINDTSILVASFQQLLLFNTRTLQFKNVFSGTQWENNIQVHKIIQHSTNEYWIGTESGIYITDFSDGKKTSIQKQYANPYSLNDNVVTDMCIDKEGGVWIGTFFGGINYHSRQLNEIQKYFPLPGINSLSGNLVHEICADNKNNLWIGTEDGGLNKLNLSTGIFKHFMPGMGKGSISYQNIHGLLMDGNELWIGTYEHGIDVMDLRSEKVTRHYEKSDRPNSLNGNFIVCFYKTRSGDILVGTWTGLFRYNRKENNFSLMPYFERQAQALHEDSDGTLWVCSYGEGVYYYNEATHSKGSFSCDVKNPESLTSNYVNNLFEDRNKNIWFCTESGLCRFNRATKKIERFTHIAALADNQVFRILQDNNGYLWISTSKGLIRFDPNSQQAKVYNTNNGLITDQFNYNSAYKDDSNRMYFGTVAGMISLKPDAFTQNTFIPPVYITGLEVNNKETHLRDSASPLLKSISYTKEITLPYDKSTISLTVAALSYTMPVQNEYMYKMEGYDKDWTLMKANRKIYYTKLPPGHYTFRLKGASSNGTWNNNETLLAITIRPPLWATGWAYALYSLLILAIVFVVLRYYYLAIKEKSKRQIAALELEKEREIYNAKIEFFTNVAHEIRTPLTLIKMPLDILIRDLPQNGNYHESLQMMKKNTNRLIDLSNQLLDFRKTEANKFSLNFTRNDINELLLESFQNFKSVADQKGLQYKLEMPRISLQAYVDTEAFRKILTNLFNNAIKYASSEVIARLLPFSSEDTTFTIEIKNDGYLIPYNLKEKVFEPFYRIKQTEEQTGTGIGLPLSRSLAELHKGVLDLKQPQGHLNVFSLAIPIHQDIEINLSSVDNGDNEPDSIGQETDHTKDASKPFILIVEDNKEILQLLQKELKANYNVLKAGNGQEALDIMLNENIQLVISDIMMPVMDGIELCKKIKTDLQYSHIPVILLTAKKTLNSKIEGLEVGADAYIEKPFDLEHLQAQITNLLTNRKKLSDYFAHSPLTHIRGIASTKADSNFLEALNTAIYDNITDMDMDVDKLAKMMNLSRPTLYRKIKGLSNLSPNELINLTRLKKAAELLASGGYKVNEVSNLVGYSLLTNFSRDFNKQFGISPSMYIYQLREEEAKNTKQAT